MNVSADLMMKLAIACGAAKDCFADGVVRCAIERLEGPREYHLEILGSDGRWDFHSYSQTLREAVEVRAQLRASFDRQFRIVELLRKVLP